MLKKITIFTAVLFVCLVALPTNAAPDASSQIPELNPFCWRRADCNTVRKQFGTSDDKSGFITGAAVAPCLGGGAPGSADEWGRCLPAGTSKTEISFGGKDQFTNIGDFILVMYKYLLTIASIVAVVVVIIAGIQWVTSGGNSEAIGSAKKRIAGALVGLFIAYMSYFVLNTINPALVNLRLPQTWLIRPQALMTEFCKDLPLKNGQPRKLSYVAAKDQPDIPVPSVAGRVFKIPDNKDLECGNRLLAEDGGEQTCRGNVCSDESAPDCFDLLGNNKTYICGISRVSGRISNSAVVNGCGWVAGSVFLKGVTGEWSCPPISDTQLTAVCNNKMVPEKADFSLSAVTLAVASAFSFDSSEGENFYSYRIKAKKSDVLNLAGRCDLFGGLKGFVVEATMEEEKGANESLPHFIGKNGVDLGDNWFFSIAHRTDRKFLFSLDEVLAGAKLDIDVANISRSHDSEADFSKYWDR